MLLVHGTIHALDANKKALSFMLYYTWYVEEYIVLYTFCLFHHKRYVCINTTDALSASTLSQNVVHMADFLSIIGSSSNRRDTYLPPSSAAAPRISYLPSHPHPDSTAAYHTARHPHKTSPQTLPESYITPPLFCNTPSPSSLRAFGADRIPPTMFASSQPISPGPRCQNR